MVRFVALFLLVLGVSGLQNKALEQLNALKEKSMQQVTSVSVDTLEQTKQSLDKYLESFQKKDLKDNMVYQEYLAVRDGAKRATAMLENARKANPPFPPTPSVTDWVNDDDEAEVEDMEADKIEAAQLKAKMEEEQEDELAEEVKQEEQKEQRKLKLKTKKLHLKKESAEEKERVRNLQQKFSSPYRAASKKAEQEVEVVDEGAGNYGKYKNQIFGSSMIETQSERLPASPEKLDRLYSELAKFTKSEKTLHMDERRKKAKEYMRLRDQELADDAQRHEHAKVLAAHAHELCEDRKMCHFRVDQKLLSGYYDKFLAYDLDRRHARGQTPHYVPYSKIAQIPNRLPAEFKSKWN